MFLKHTLTWHLKVDYISGKKRSNEYTLALPLLFRSNIYIINHASWLTIGYLFYISFIGVSLLRLHKFFFWSALSKCVINQNSGTSHNTALWTDDSVYNTPSPFYFCTSVTLLCNPSQLKYRNKSQSHRNVITLVEILCICLL